MKSGSLEVATVQKNQRYSQTEALKRQGGCKSGRAVTGANQGADHSKNEGAFAGSR